MVDRKYAYWLLSSIFVVILFFPGISQHYQNYHDFYALNDDARPQVAPFYAYKINPYIKEDYNSKYYLDAIYPMGFGAMMKVWSSTFDPVTISKILPYIQFFVLLASLMLIARKLGGNVACFITVIFLCASDIFFQRMIGGLSRSFGFPLIAAALAFGVYGRYMWLSATVVLGALFYPVVAVVSGLYMAALLLCVPRKLSVIRLSLVKKFALLGVTAAISILILLPQFVSGQEYGDRVTYGDRHLYPEAGEHGRNGPEDRPPFPGLISEVFMKGVYTFYSRGDSLVSERSMKTQGVFIAVIILSLLIIFNFIRLIRQKNKDALPIIVFTGVIIVAYYASVLVYPHFYIPKRYTMYTLPIVFIIAAPLALQWYVAKYFNKKYSSLLVVIFVLAFVLIFNGRGNGNAGYTVRTKMHKDLYSFVERLPDESVIAGWPKGVLDNIPYYSRKRVLVNYEFHQALHIKAIEENRELANALFDAYFTTKIDDLYQLRDKYNVTHLIINKDHFTSRAEMKYFVPFNSRIKSLRSSAKGNYFLRNVPVKDSVIYQKENMLILDMLKL